MLHVYTDNITTSAILSDTVTTYCIYKEAFSDCAPTSPAAGLVARTGTKQTRNPSISILHQLRVDSVHVESQREFNVRYIK
jgi:hypothetical protein